MLKNVKTLAYIKEKVYICSVKIKKICLTVPRGTLKFKVMATLIRAISQSKLDSINFDAVQTYCNLRQLEYVIDTHIFGFTDHVKPFYQEVTMLINVKYTQSYDDLRFFLACLRLNHKNVDFELREI